MFSSKFVVVHANAMSHSFYEASNHKQEFQCSEGATCTRRSQALDDCSWTGRYGRLASSEDFDLDQS